MAIQEFMIDEARDIAEIPERGEQWSKLVEDLGLEGQRQLCSVSPESPIPFPAMNKEMVRVYETLCPVKRVVKDYNKTAIPIRVLEIAGFCVMKEYFGKIEVWYDDKEPDPILVGCDGEDKYILARWAAEIEEYAVLRRKAIERKAAEMIMKLEKNKQECMNAVTNVNNLTAQWMTGDWVHEGGVSW